MVSAAMQALYNANLILHILTGAIALLSVIVPAIAKKGGSVHRKAGWVFTIAMAIAAVTGVLIAAAWLVAPLTVKPLDAEANPQQLAQHARSLRLTAPFFGLLSVMTGYAVWGGIASLRRVDNRWITGGFGVAITAIGIVVLIIGLRYGQLVFTIFGALAAASAANGLRTLADPPPKGRERIISHLQAMFGGATAAATAFTVQVASRFTGSDFASVAMWVAPLLLGLGTSYAFTKSLRGKRGAERA